MKIETEVEQAATTHLNVKDKNTALSHFTDDVFAISNTRIFSSREELAAEIDEYYKILKSVNHAEWEDIHIHVINEKAATFTAKFNYGFTSIDDEVTNLRGVWTALFILDHEAWKIRLRHESVEQI
ncbi:MAG: nuclear transport factor 2 family protein [Candidatus Thiodiazotropha sp.]